MHHDFSRRSTVLSVIAVLALFMAAILPSLDRLDFLDGVEHFNLATVQEMRRNELLGQHVNWMLPTLQADARVVKPPLTAWLASLLVSPGDMAGFSSPDASVRERTMSQFVFRARLPSLVCAGLFLLGVFVLGQALAMGDRRVGVVAMLVCASTVLFFEQSRRATTDLQLALWVTWTNALLAEGIFRRRSRLGFIGGGLMLGLASMAKGPHIALLMTLFPLGVYWLLSRRFRGGVDDSPRPSPRLPIIIGSILALVIGLGWYAYVAGTVPGISEVWWREMTRKNAQLGRNVMPPDAWYSYLSIAVLMLPWTGWFLLGTAWLWPVAPDARNGGAMNSEAGQPPPALQSSAGRSARRLFPMTLALLLVVLPIVLMSFFAEKKERYLLPFAAPAACVMAFALIRWWDGRKQHGIDGILGLLMSAVTVSVVLWLSLAPAICGSTGAKDCVSWNGMPWFSRFVESTVTATVGFALLAGFFLAKRTLLAPLLAILICALIGGELTLRGRQLSSGDPDNRPQQELAARIWQRWPDATVYSTDPVTLYGQLNRPAIVLSMYLNRVISTRPKDLPQSPQAVPLVLITDSLDASPPSVPPGWNRFTTIKLRRGARYVDVLNVAGAAASH